MNKIILVALLVIIGVVVSLDEPYRNHKLFDLNITSLEQQKDLEKLEAEGKIDVWTETPVDGKYTVRVAPENMVDFVTYIIHSHVSVNLVDNDLQVRIFNCLLTTPKGNGKQGEGGAIKKKNLFPWCKGIRR